MSQTLRRPAILLLLLLLPCPSLLAETVEVPAAFEPPSLAPEARPQPRLLLEATALEPVASLAAARLAAAGEIEAIAAWNRAGNKPQKIGFVRPLEIPVQVEIAPATRSVVGAANGGLLQSSPEEGYTWVSRFEAAESSRLRLRLRAEGLPADTRMMVYNEAGETIAFGLELRSPDGELWTPSVAGPVLFLEVQGQNLEVASRFAVDAIAERFELGADGAPVLSPQGGVDPRVITSCIETSACVSSGTLAGIADYRAAVAHIIFSKDGDEYICSAGLLNDQNPSGFIPYALTANHCFSSQSSASSLEAFWDYHAASCGGAVPTLGSLPRSNGASLLATSANTDFTFVRLNSAPNGSQGRVYLGWTTTLPADGATLHGLHHPLGLQQSYTRFSNDRTPASVCGGAPTSNFLYVNTLDGATFGGSSGSPITTATLQVVGQLFGGCGPNSEEPCLAGSSDYDVYGAFSVTKSSLSQWLDDTGGGNTPCVDSSTTLCLLNKRFKVEATYRTAGGQTGAGKAVRLTDETGYFWFFNASNIEAVFKLLNACRPELGNHFWVFAGGLTDVEVTTVVTDTAASGAGSTKTYVNPLGTPFQPITDLTSFATCP